MQDTKCPKFNHYKAISICRAGVECSIRPSGYHTRRTLTFTVSTSHTRTTRCIKDSLHSPRGRISLRLTLWAFGALSVWAFLT